MLDKVTEKSGFNDISFDNNDRKLVLEAIKEYRKVIKMLMSETKKANMKEYYKEKLDRITEINKHLLEELEEEKV